MLIANAQAVAKFLGKNRDVAKWMTAWTDTTLEAEWSSIQDVRQDFPSVDGVHLRDGAVVTVFNVKGNTYRLFTTIAYVSKVVWIVDILTHAEYSKNKWKG